MEYTDLEDLLVHAFACPHSLLMMHSRITPVGISKSGCVFSEMLSFLCKGESVPLMAWSIQPANNLTLAKPTFEITQRQRSETPPKLVH